MATRRIPDAGQMRPDHSVRKLQQYEPRDHRLTRSQGVFDQRQRSYLLDLSLRRIKVEQVMDMLFADVTPPINEHPFAVNR